MKMFKGKTSIIVTGRLVTDSLIISCMNEARAVILVDIETSLPIYIKKRQKFRYYAPIGDEIIDNIGLSKEGHQVKIRLQIFNEDSINNYILEFENLTLKIGKSSIIEL